MKIIFLGDSIATQKTGIHYYGVQLVHLITKQHPEHQYAIVLPAQDPQFNFQQIIVPVRKGSQWHLRLRQLWTIPKMVQRENPDMVIELAHFGPFGLSNRIKRVTVIHDLTPILFPKFHGPLSVWVHRLLLPFILKKAHHLLVNSNYTKRDLANLYQVPADKMTVVYPQIVLPKTGATIVNPISLPKPYFLTVGTIEPRKNHLTILKAFELFCETNAEYNLVIAGKKGWMSKPFFQAYEKSKVKDRILLTGYISRTTLWQYYRHAHAFVFASYYEGFGLPVLEAMSFGLPLIVVDNPSVIEIAKSYALFFDAENVDLLSAHLMKSTNEDLRDALQKKSKARYQLLCRSKKELDFL